MAITSKHMELSQELIAQLMIEYWKLASVSSKMAELLPPSEKKRLSAQISYSILQLRKFGEGIGIKLITFDDERFISGMAAKAENLDEFREDDVLVVAKTIEPAVLQNDQLISMARVILKVADKQ